MFYLLLCETDLITTAIFSQHFSAGHAVCFSHNAVFGTSAIFRNALTAE